MAFHIEPRFCKYCNIKFNPPVYSCHYCSLECRFWGKVKIALPDECWEWQASTNAYGYGQIAINKRPFAAHRIAWEIENGKINMGLFVLHKCDNRLCCNTTHLFLGTQKDNMKDKYEKNRNPRGVDLPFSKLSENDVLTIRGKIKLGLSQRDLASKFNMSQTAISKIVRRETWKHLV